MKATEILVDEHRVILRLLDAMEAASARIGKGQEVPAAFFLGTAEVLHGFADDCHHCKEEGVLFKAMTAHGLPAQGGPIAVMLQEHEAGRALVRGLRPAVERWQAGATAAAKEAARLALECTALLRQHFDKENGMLFPLVDRMIPAEAQEQLAGDFEAVEYEETGAGVHEKYLALVDSLTDEASRF